MRQIYIKVPEGHGNAVLKLADECDGLNLAQIRADDQSGTWDLVMVHLSNHQVSTFLEQVTTLPEAQITLIPHTVMPMTPPSTKIVQQLIDITPRSPIEIWLNSLQSIGSWKSLLGYTATASVVVWTGLFTNSIYLLVAAMLIAPFAGPAMNVAIATASGDVSLLGRNLLRYVVSIVVMIGIAWALSVVLRLTIATATMVDISEVSSIAVLLPLAAGAAGALNLVQAEKSSLVSGSAVGVLVAASLAPPAGLIGMAAALGRWSMSLNGAFVLVLQLAAINLSGTIVLRIAGLDTQGPRYQRGTSWLFRTSVVLTSLLLVALLVWQFHSPIDLQRSTVAGRAAGLVEEQIKQSGLAHLVEANVRFTRPDISQQKTLLAVVYVQRADDTQLPNEEIQERLRREVIERLQQWDGAVVPLVDIQVLTPAWEVGKGISREWG